MKYSRVLFVSREVLGCCIHIEMRKWGIHFWNSHTIPWNVLHMTCKGHDFAVLWIFHDFYFCILTLIRSWLTLLALQILKLDLCAESQMTMRLYNFVFQCRDTVQRRRSIMPRLSLRLGFHCVLVLCQQVAFYFHKEWVIIVLWKRSVGIIIHIELSLHHISIKYIL